MQQELTIISTCTKCDSCNLICPENAVLNINGNYHIDSFSCTMCNLCVEICPEDCIKKVTSEYLK